MREFAKVEILSHKCDICGSRNKRFGEYIVRGERTGYVLVCCNCGKVLKFLNSVAPLNEILTPLFSIGKEICLRQSNCLHPECPYYQLTEMWNQSETDFDSIYDSQQKLLCALSKEDYVEPFREILPDTQPDYKNKKFL